MIIRKFSAIAKIHQIITYSIPHLDKSPPIAGPIKNASQKAAPISHIFFVLSAGWEISDIYACTTPNPAPQRPEIKRAIIKIINKILFSKERICVDRLRYSTIYPRRFSHDVITRRFFRP
jgi:hypothetical protein